MFCSSENYEKNVSCFHKDIKHQISILEWFLDRMKDWSNDAEKSALH